MNEPDIETVAVIGMAGRFPGAATVEQFWRNLLAGVESISKFTDDELTAAGLDVAALKREPGFVAARGVLKEAEWFDAAFFGMIPKEAEVTDPQQRLFLEAAWEALENAGYDPARYPGPIGVYAGAGNGTYYINNLHGHPGMSDALNVQLGNEKDFLATRVAYKLNLKGPAMSVNTACSTSLVAVCQACQSLLNFQCDIALAGGVSITFPQRRTYHYQEGGIISPDGHCRAFDAQAQGTVSSDGLGLVVLKRLSEALKDGDEIHAVIKGAALNNDGSTKVSFTSPSVDGQAEAIALAQAQAGFDPATISYIEAHGTATPLGDPIEIAALTQAFGTGASKNFCALGSVKTNIGHLDTAAGVAGLIKTVLALKHKQLPASLHFERPNPRIDFANSPFYVNERLAEWKAGATPRRAGVSSFGLGGTNAHVVLEEAPPRQSSASARDWQLLVISAKTAAALDTATTNLLQHLKANPTTELPDAAFTLQTGRAEFNHRRMLVCRDGSDAATALQTGDPKRVLTRKRDTEDAPVVFMFPGQGAQYVNMGAELYRTEPVFKAEVDRCADLLRPRLEHDLRDVLFPASEQTNAAEELLRQTRFTQPALFVIELAVARLWMSWGIKPRAMIGHSVGEYVAGCLAGVFTVEEALGLVAARARLIQEQPGGAMLAVRLKESDVLPFLRDGLSLAAVNSFSSCVVSGPYEAVASLERILEERGVAARRLQTSHAFHSGMMDPVIGPFTELLRKVKFKEPTVPYVSNVTARWVTAAEATSPEYWAGHVRQAVRFADGIAELMKDPQYVLLEAGPGQTLSALARQNSAITPGRVALASFFAAKEKMSETCAMLDALGRLWLAGVKVDWNGFHAQAKRRRVALPTYPFERKRYWVEPPARAKDQPATSAPAITPAPANATPEHEPVLSTPVAEAPATLPRKERIIAMLRAQLEELSGASLAGLVPSTTFAEMGFDSLFLSQASHAFQKKFGIKVAFRQLLEKWPTLNDLAGHFDEKLPTDAFSELDAAQRPALEASAPNVSAETVTIPLTEAQLEVWSAAELGEDASRAFNQVVSIRLHGTMHLDALRQAIQELIDRHDALRASFLPGGAGQQITAALKLSIPLVDLSPFNESERDGQLVALAAKEDQTAFDLVNGPLVRAQIIRLSKVEHVLLLATHHLVTDGWSLTVALDELGSIYAAKARGEAHQLARAMQYREYVQWQNGPENRTRITETENHWMRQFASLPTAVELPADRPRPATKTYRAGTASLHVDSGFRRLLKEAAAREGCTLFAYLFASFTVWLKRLSRQDDLTVGVPAAGQVAAEDAQGLAGRSLIGHCANLLPIRCRCEGDPSFKEWLNTVRSAVLDAHEHQEFTFGSLVKKLNPPRDPSRVPLVSTTFNLVRAAGKSRWPELEAEISFPPKGFNIFDLTVDVLDTGEELRIEGRFNSDLFDATTMQRWLGHWKTLLEETLANPAQTVGTLPMLNETERRQLLLEWNNTRQDFPEQLCAHQLIEAQAKASPDAVAVVYEKESLTYRELDQRADQLAEQLKAQGVGPKTLVGVFVERSIEMIIGLLGIWKAGAAYVPLDPNFPPDRLKLIVRDAQVVTVLTQAGLLEDLRNIAPGAKSAGHTNLKNGQNSREIVIAVLGDSHPASNASGGGPDTLAYVLFTSGSTGKPKGVQISHRALVNFLTSTTREPGLKASDVLVAVTTLSFDIAGLELWLPLVTGARVVIAPSEVARDGKRLAALLAESKATVMQATPATWRMLLETGWQGDTNLKILCGGEGWPEELARQLLSRCGSLWNMYGPTETTIWSAAGKVESPEVPRIGPPLANTQLYVLDAHLQPTPIGVPGELHIGGAGLAHGYLDRPELTSEKFIPDHLGGGPGARLYKTGDLARYQADGKIEFLGRMDQQVKIRGHRIELGEVEAVLRKEPNVGDVAAMIREDAKGEKCLVAYVVARQPTNANELRGFLKAKLPDYMVPSLYVVMDGLPLTPNGKVDRKALPAPDTQPKADEYAPPETPAEIAVAKLWCELLGREQVGRHDNFFDLGGHSLMATQLISRLETFHGVESSLRDVMDSPTVAEMSRWLEKKK